jgi:HD-GYP domain-containing protein (c-di-GMP phosphodiesterase class II)
MKQIPLSSLTPGTTASSDYYSDRGELLISKGTEITARHLELLKKRSIFELYQKPQNEDEEIEHLAFKEVKDVDTLEAAIIPEKIDIQTLEKGKVGLDHLKKSDLSINLDRNLRLLRTSDKPTGTSLSSKSSQMETKDRTQNYKKELTDLYQNALDETTYVLNTLARGGAVSARKILSLVQQFAKVFITDRNILLNLSGTKHPRDDYLYHHSLNVCLLSINIAAACGYSEEQVVEIGAGALLHDVGMMAIPGEIRTLASRLDQEQWYEVQKHPILGLHLLERIKSLPESVPYVAYQQHEREDGRGYPKQRSTLLIHRFAKMVQVADVYEAMSSPRAYRPALIPYKAMECVIKMVKEGLLSNDFVKAFLEYASLFPVGSLVELSNKCVAKVIGANRHSISRPLVSVILDKDGLLLKKSQLYQIDLYKSRDIAISKALPSDFIKSGKVMDGF